MKRIKSMLTRISIFIMTYLLVPLINWTFNVSLWRDFSIFMLALTGLVLFYMKYE